jgi:uncharacterized protein (TIGR00369 family)
LSIDDAALRAVMEAHIPFNKFLGMRVAEIDRGRIRMEIPFRDELVGDPLRPALHGGVISALADTAGGAAVWSAIEDPRARPTTIDLRIDYLRPGKLEALIAEATLVRIGRRIGVVDIRLFHKSAPADTIATGKGVYGIRVPRA